MVMCRSTVQNGDFEQGAEGWRAGEGVLPETIVEAPDRPGKAVLLGDPNYACNNGVPVNQQASMSQTFLVPSCMRNPTLRWTYRYFSQDKTDVDHKYDFDFFAVYLNDDILPIGYEANLDKEQSCDVAPWDSGWKTGSFDLTGHRGQLVTVAFRNWNKHDGWFNTWTCVTGVELVEGT